MNRIRKSVSRRAAILVLAATLAACGGGGTRDTTPPTATINMTGGTLDKKQSLVIVFSETMDTASLRLGGSLGTEATATWSRTAADNDTLTLAPPGGAWSGGAGRGLQVDAKDPAGNALSTLDATYVVNMLFTTFQPAEMVLGQADFASGQSNRGGATAADTLHGPLGAAVSPSGTLFVADHWNNRVLGYAPLPSANGAPAGFVLGQTSLQHSVEGNGPNRFSAPAGVSTGAGRLIVADTGNNRVLIYGSAPADGTALPEVVLGQSSLDTTPPQCSARGLSAPSTAVITEDGKVIVTDTGNNRILIWNSIPTAHGQAADLVLGQPDFGQCVLPGSATAQNMLSPHGVWSDGHRLAVADSRQNRVLIWNSIPTSNFQPADIVLGQGGFTSANENDGGISGRSLLAPIDLASNGSQFAVADFGNHRILVWNSFPTTNFQPADVVLGQDDFNSLARNDVDQDGVADTLTSAQVFNGPIGVAFYRDRLIVSDYYNHRLLVFRAP